MNEISNKNTVNVNVEMMSFKKYVQSFGILYNEVTIKINGTFREKPSGNVIKEDIFKAHTLGKLNIKDIYKTYLAWFNHTRTKNEEEREFVNVKKENKEE